MLGRRGEVQRRTAGGALIVLACDGDGAVAVALGEQGNAEGSVCGIRAEGGADGDVRGMDVHELSEEEGLVVATVPDASLE